MGRDSKNLGDTAPIPPVATGLLIPKENQVHLQLRVLKSRKNLYIF